MTAARLVLHSKLGLRGARLIIVRLTENSIIKQHVECKIENKEKLKQVKNLEELIKFNIKTVADKMVEDGVMVTSQSQKKGLYALRKVCDPLLASSALP